VDRSSAHGLGVEPALTAEELGGLEAYLGVALPEDTARSSSRSVRRIGAAALVESERSCTAGAICLEHIGCAQRRWLVVSGPARGQMWDDPRADELDLRPLVDRTPRG
jgi:hypothetical protein